MTIKELQKRAYENKVRHHFNVTDIPLEFCYLNRELGEAFEAYQNRSNKIGEELADTGIYLLGLCEIIGVDLEKEILSKMNINESRIYIGNNKYRIELGNMKLENNCNLVLVNSSYETIKEITYKCLEKEIGCIMPRPMSDTEIKESAVIVINLDEIAFAYLEDRVHEVLRDYPNNVKIMVGTDKDNIKYLYNKLNHQDIGVYVYSGRECQRLH